MCHTGPAPDTDFNPRPPRGGRRGLSATNIRYTAISIHAPREGGDFQYFKRSCVKTDISIHAPREGGDFYMAALLTSLGISIHAPREVGDVCDFANSLKVSAISIHAPREGGDSVHAPREGGDSVSCRTCSMPWDFNPRPPRGGRP